MPFDIVGYSEAAPGTGEVYLAAGLKDTLYKFSNDDIMVRAAAPYVLGVFAAAESTGERIMIRQPSLALDYEIQKIADTADVEAILGYTHMFGRPLPLVAGEKLNVLIDNATDEDAIVGLILGSGRITQSALEGVNPTHRITGYSDTTITANTWSPCTLTWNQDLPEGTYNIVGLRVGVYLAANPWAAIARLTGLKEAVWRPGVPCSIMSADHERYEEGYSEPFVDWPIMPGIQCTHDDLPDIEVLSPAAHTDENVELLLQKIA